MAYTTVAPSDDRVTTDVIDGRDGRFITLRIGYDVSIYIPGADSVAVVNARQWAKALTEAADQIVAKLEHETVAEVV